MRIGYSFTVSEYEVTPAARRWFVLHSAVGARAIRFERLVQRADALNSATYIAVRTPIFSTVWYGQWVSKSLLYMVFACLAM